ncbi:hypothetical protein CXU17_05770 [Akkermansia muciniphila]|nr:hypothetical protein CXU17_05770 [Akkermansia muciniphila]
MIHNNTRCYHYGSQRVMKTYFWYARKVLLLMINELQNHRVWFWYQKWVKIFLVIHNYVFHNNL